MMNLLLDFIPFQSGGGVGGAATFTKAITDEILLQCDTSRTKLFAVYDSSFHVGQQYNYVDIATRHNITLLDIHSQPLAKYIQQHHIDTFFIAIGQFYARYDLSGISCRTIMFIHDIFDVESCDNRIDLSITDQQGESRFRHFKRVANFISGRWHSRMQRIYRNIIPLYSAPHTLAYTVSEYTAHSLRYYFPEIRKDIRVCYSPMKSSVGSTNIENNELRQLIESNKTYLLFVAANRLYKNPQTLLKVYLRLLNEYPDLHLVTLKYGKSLHPNHIDISFLSDSDLEHAYRHARALVFASYFEGFGYPPIEALRWGTPVVASNVTSIPEILGEAGVYFSPFYPADLYRAIKSVLQNPDIRKEAIAKRYQEVSQRQQSDLRDLVKQILHSA